MLSNYHSSLYNIYGTPELSFNDLSQFFRVGTDNQGREQLVLRTGASYNPEYIAISDLISYMRDFNTHYNITISQLNTELDSLKQKLSEFENLEPANDIIDRIEKLEFLIEEN